jgi:hypothetical protein
MMADPRSVIERGLARAGSESYTLDSFYRRRDRKRARTRITAGVVGLAIAIVLAVIGSSILRSAPEDKDVGGKGPRILRDGEVLQVVDQFGPAATLRRHGPRDGTSAHPAWLQRRLWMDPRVQPLDRERLDRVGRGVRPSLV